MLYLETQKDYFIHNLLKEKQLRKYLIKVQFRQLD